MVCHFFFVRDEVAHFLRSKRPFLRCGIKQRELSSLPYDQQSLTTRDPICHRKHDESLSFSCEVIKHVDLTKVAHLFGPWALRRAPQAHSRITSSRVAWLANMGENHIGGLKETALIGLRIQSHFTALFARQANA